MMIQKDLELDRRWHQLMNHLTVTVGKRPADLEAVLFIIGLQELGQGIRSFTKEEKQDLMHIAVCKVLSLSGFYTLEGQDQDGWPHWQLIKKLPSFDLLEQEKLLKMHILEYLEVELFGGETQEN